MSYIISPNIALGFGVILSIYDSNDTIIEIINCQNRATAEYIFRTYNPNPKIADMARSFLLDTFGIR